MNVSVITISRILFSIPQIVSLWALSHNHSPLQFSRNRILTTWHTSYRRFVTRNWLLSISLKFNPLPWSVTFQIQLTYYFEQIYSAQVDISITVNNFIFHVNLWTLFKRSLTLSCGAAMTTPLLSKLRTHRCADKPMWHIELFKSIHSFIMSNRW